MVEIKNGKEQGEFFCKKCDRKQTSICFFDKEAKRKKIYCRFCGKILIELKGGLKDNGN